MLKFQKKHYLFTLIISLIVFAIIYIQTRPTLRYAVFAGYNKNGIIEPYVITYLQGLSEITDGIVYITDSPLEEKEQKKLKKFNILYQFHAHHGEYDWGSYKRGIHFLKVNGYLEKAEELILANDSTYAPLKSFVPMFKEMSKRKDLDFWGNSMNTKFNTHLQSYFLVFRKKVLNSPSFHQFMNSVSHQQDGSLYILKYEINLTSYLESLGYKWGYYLPYEKMSHLPIKDKNTYPLTLIQGYHNQFLKRRTFTEKLLILEDIDKLLEYIQKHHQRTYLDILSARHQRLQHLQPK